MKIWLPLALVVLQFSFNGAAYADERALQQALAKAQFMLKQVSAEKVAVEQEMSKEKEDFAKYKKKSESELEAREQGSVRLAGNISAIKERYGELADKYRELQIALKEAKRDAQTKELGLDAEQRKFQLCYDNNKKLYDINQEILGNYEEKGIWEVLKEKEPFTGFASVKMEEFIQDYQYKNEDLKLDDALLGSADTGHN